MKTVTRLLPVLLVLALVACGSPEERAAEHLEKATQLYEQGDLVKAKLEAQNTLQIEPKNARARYLLAEIAEKDKDFRGAIGHLLVAVDSDPDYVEARVKLGNYYFLGKAVEQAEEQARAAMELAPDDPQVLLLDARVKYLKGDKAAAIKSADAALAADPDLSDAIIFRAGLYAESKDFDSAFKLVDAGIKRLPADQSENLRQFRLQLLAASGRKDEIEADLIRLAQDYPDNTQYRYALAQLYQAQKRPEAAENVLKELVALEPDNNEHKINLTKLLITQGRLDDAEALLRDYVKQDPENADLQIALGDFLLSYRNADDALAVYQALADKAPASPEGLKARNRIAAVYIREGKLDDARKLTEAILADAPDDPDALLRRAAFRFTGGDYEGAIADLRVVLRKDEKSERALLLLARSYVRNGDATLAQDAYRRLLAIKPNDEQASTELAALLAGQGDTDAAEKLLRERLEANPDAPIVASALVQTLLMQKDLSEAEALARLNLEQNENSPLATFQLGQVMQAKGSSDEAIAAYRLTLEKNPRALPALRGLIGLLVQEGRADEAEAYLKQHLKDNPEQVAPLFLLGSVYASEGKKDLAAETYEKVLKKQPEAARVYIALANLYPQDSDEQAAAYERGVKANPVNPDLTVLLGSLYERRGEFDKAIDLYSSFLEKSPDNEIVINNLAASLLDHRDDKASLERAMTLVNKLRNSDQPALLDTVGWAYYRNGDPVTAVRYLERAVAGMGNVPVLHYHLGMAYAATGNVPGAKQELGKALDQVGDSRPDWADEAQKKLAEL